MVPFLLLLISQDSQTYEAKSSYRKEEIEGFTVLISAKAVEAPEELAPALALLKLRFSEIARRTPKDALSTLQTIPIWVERNNEKFPCMCYHESAEWLRQNGMNPEKAKGVELANLKNFVTWSYDQPLMVFHEYAHGYHDAKFGFNGKVILEAYQKAMEQKLYDEVLYYRGQKRKAYAATNQMEYFAELSEALFGYNDYFPFTRPELAAHDPLGFETVKRAWGLSN